MHARITVSLLCGASLVTSFNCFAQGAASGASSCVATPAQVAANKKVATAFFRPDLKPEERIALIDPSYVQHNPRFKKAADEEKISAYEEFKKMFANRGPGNWPPADTTHPQQPKNVELELVTAECDLVTVIHKNYRQDPTAAPGTFYEAFTFDTFRVRNGKLVEHWDSATIDPLPPPPAGK